ncbi:MAG: hypothetical protein IGS54_05580 [Elainella sp. C42_A2020_010]|nr:hypothetical protein [Elainella sp. C42_A2020_010]
MAYISIQGLGQASDLEYSDRDPGSSAVRPSGEVLPYRQAMESIGKGLQEEYKRNCAGVTVLRTLSRESLTPLEKVKKLERKLEVISRLVQGQKLISKMVGKYRMGKISKKQLVASLQGILHAFPELKEFPFPQGYAVGSEAQERAKVQCELSQARWEWFASQSGRPVARRAALNGLGLGQATSGNVCSGYKPGEIKTSKTQKGHLPIDVRLTTRGLEIADFGVNWRGVKEATKQEQLLKDWLSKFESNPNYRLRIIGYSDCIGKEKNNNFLREGRAKRVYELLGKNARSQTFFVGSASPGTYITDNSTVEGRATNRGVVIEIYTPKPSCPYALKDALKIELDAARKTLGLSAHVAKSFLRSVGALDARGRFTETILDNKYWFAKLYELITYYEIAEVQRFEHPGFVLHFIPIFYNLYHESLQNFWQGKLNQISQLWINHFQTAGRPSWNSVSGFANQVLKSIVTGVAAHIQGDMAIALEQAYRSYTAKYCLSNLRFDDFRKDFFENNRPIFEMVQAAFFLELSRRGPFPVRPDVGQFIIGTGAQLTGGGLDIDEVYRWRAEAWETAKKRLGQ